VDWFNTNQLSLDHTVLYQLSVDYTVLNQTSLDFTLRQLKGKGTAVPVLN